MKLVSIIVPVYNRSYEIEKCYKNLINQTYKKIEIVFVDDGSTDDSLEVIKKFDDKRVVVVSQKNSGFAEARRRGFRESKGEYILFVDSDDTIDKDFVFKLVKSMEDNNSNMTIGRISVQYYLIFKYITLKSKRKPKKIDLEKKREYLPAFSSMIIGKLFKRELLDLKKLDFKVNEEMAIMYPMYVKCKNISVVNDAIYHHQLAKTSQFKKYLLGYKFENLFNTFEPLRYIYEEFEKMDKLENYYYEIEMLFIKNIFEIIWDIMDSVSDKIYRYKFISAILDYLECFFPDWDKNPYYVRGYKLGDLTDRYHIRVVYGEISRIKRKKLYISLEEVYDKYRKIERMYESSK